MHVQGRELARPGCSLKQFLEHGKATENKDRPVPQQREARLPSSPRVCGALTDPLREFPKFKNKVEVGDNEEILIKI